MLANLFAADLLGDAPGASGGLSKRAQLMLELVVDIKNNKKTRAAGGGGQPEAALAGAGARKGLANASLSPGIKKWLQAAGVEEVRSAVGQ